MDEILDPLNEQQREAVLHTDGPVLVLAGAGSGKTRVITHRFAHLLREKNLGLQNILAVTFTNKAAGEMKERISVLTGADTRHAWVRTFHSMGVLILRRDPGLIGYPANFVIYDDTDSKGLARTILTSFGISPETFSPAGVSEKISSLKDRLVSPDDFDKQVLSEFDKVTARVYREYERLLRKNRAVDFPDLIALPIKVFTENPAVLESYRDLWRYVMVDEFQDTNAAQYRLVTLIADRDRNACVVGDDDQSIYGWRGANVDNIYDFRDRYGAKVIPLERNYRSTQTILSAANGVVSRIAGRMPKTLWTDRKSEQKITLLETLTDKEEAQRIAETLDGLLKDHDYRDFAVFYRTNAQSRLFEEELLSRNIPYRIFGGQKFFERKEIKDVLSYVRLCANPFDGASFERIINVPRRKIGDSTVAKLKSAATERNVSYLDILLPPSGLDVGPALGKTLNDLGRIFSDLREGLEKMAPTEFFKVLIESIHYKSYITAFDEDGLDRWSNVEELINSVKHFETANPDRTVADYLNEVTLQTSVDALAEDGDRNYVSLMTMHNAKGLEFPVVFVSGVVSGLVPHVSSTYSEKDLNEERRLFYVAITRAKDRLTLSYPDTRMKYGEFMECLPSPFLKDIPGDLLEKITPRSRWGGEFRRDRSGGSVPERRTSRSRTETLDDMEDRDRTPIPGKLSGVSSLADIAVGDVIRHRQFGTGRVEFVCEKFVKVKFDKYGVQNISGNFLSSVEVAR